LSRIKSLPLPLKESYFIIGWVMEDVGTLKSRIVGRQDSIEAANYSLAAGNYYSMRIGYHDLRLQPY